MTKSVKEAIYKFVICVLCVLATYNVGKLTCKAEMKCLYRDMEKSCYYDTETKTAHFRGKGRISISLNCPVWNEEQNRYITDEKYKNEVEHIIVYDGVTAVMSGDIITGRAKTPNLISVTLPDSVETIEENAFSWAPKLESINFPKNLKSIGEEAFTRTGLKEVVLPEGVTTIGVFSFGINPDLTSIYVPSSVEYIGHGAFDGCSRLTNVTLCEGIQEIDYSAFAECTSLEQIVIPESVILKKQIFANCASLKSVKLSSKQKELLPYLFTRSGLTSYTVPEGITKISVECFEGCKSLKSVKLASTVKTIDKSVFENCTSLTSITIPDSVESISADAFKNCKALKQLTINCKKADKLKINKKAFASTKSKIKVTVNCKNEKEFKKIEKILKKSGLKKPNIKFKKLKNK